jgi:hypothetical protein
MIPFDEDSRITVASVNVAAMPDGKGLMKMVDDHCSPTYLDTSDISEDLYSMETFADIAYDTSVPERLREFCVALATEEREASYIRFINVPQ